MSLELKIKRISNENGELPILPSYKTEGAAAMDLCYFGREPIIIAPNERKRIPTGLQIEIPNGYVGLLFIRSGISINYGLSLINGVGVIDCDYRGEICAGVINHSEQSYTILPNDRIAQLSIFEQNAVHIQEVPELSDTKRGEGGFGSTGNQA